MSKKVAIEEPTIHSLSSSSFNDWLQEFATNLKTLGPYLPPYTEEKRDPSKEGFNNFMPRKYKTLEELDMFGKNYEETYLQDAIARVTVIMKPVGAVYYTEDGGPVLKLGYNKTLECRVEELSKIILDIKSLLSMGGKPSCEALEKKLELLSKIFFFQEYKVVQNYISLLENLQGEGLFPEEALDSLKGIFEYGNNIAKYYRASTKDASTSSSEHIFPTCNFESIVPFLRELEFPLENKELLLKSVGKNELSGLFIVLHYCLSDYFCRNRESEFFSTFEDASKCFTRAIMDVERIFQSRSLNPEFSHEVIENPEKLHAELLVADIELKKPPIPEDRYKTNIITKYIGVSKGSCVLCTASLNYIGAEDYTRGCPGILYLDWVLPRWKREDAGFVEYLKSYLNEAKVKAGSYAAYDQDKYYNPSNAEFSDSEDEIATTPEATVMTITRRSDKWFKKLMIVVSPEVVDTPTIHNISGSSTEMQGDDVEGGAVPKSQEDTSLTGHNGILLNHLE